MNDLNKKTTFFDKIGVTPKQIAWLMAANLKCLNPDQLK